MSKADFFLIISIIFRFLVFLLVYMAWIWAMIEIFRNLCAIHAKRVTVMTRDIQLARRIRGRGAYGNQ